MLLPPLLPENEPPGIPPDELPLLSSPLEPDDAPPVPPDDDPPIGPSPSPGSPLPFFEPQAATAPMQIAAAIVTRHAFTR